MSLEALSTNRRLLLPWRALLAIALSATVLDCGKTHASQPSDSGSPSLSRARTVRLDPKSLERLGVKVEPAGTQAPGHRLHVPGTLDYSYTRYAEVGPLVEGRVTSISVGVGDRVKKGQVLGTMLVPALARSQADFVSAQAAAQMAQEHLAREQRLLEKNLTTAREAEKAKAEQTRTEAELAAARARLEAMGAGAVRNNAVGGAGRLPLVSTIAGLVVKRDAVLGRFLQPNQIAFVVADLTELWANLQIHEADLPYLEIGAEVDIALDADPGQVFKGKLALVEPQVGRTSRAAVARVVVPNPDEKLRPGLFVRAAIALPTNLDARNVLVPTDAVQPLGESDVVFVELGPGEFEVREVQLARHTAEVATIAKGLKRGERIAVSGAFLLRGEVIKQ